MGALWGAIGSFVGMTARNDSNKKKRGKREKRRQKNLNKEREKGRKKRVGIFYYGELRLLWLLSLALFFLTNQFVFSHYHIYA